MNEYGADGTDVLTIEVKLQSFKKFIRAETRQQQLNKTGNLWIPAIHTIRNRPVIRPNGQRVRRESVKQTRFGYVQ